MTTLAINGGTPEVRTQLRPFNTIGTAEAEAALNVLRGAPLSGYLGGERRGGYWVRKLEDEWAATFKVRHAVAVNSATSGLLAACAAVGITAGDQVITTPFTMSATSAAAAMLGASLLFEDVNQDAFCLRFGEPGGVVEVDPKTLRPNARAVMTTNLFGHPSPLGQMRHVCDDMSMVLIEDNAQSPFATEHGRYAGTIGHIGVFSLNVHKHLQCGEGGICVTDDDRLADELRAFVNHGEMLGKRAGLNLRMTEITAAIALAQLRKADQIIAGRVALAESLTAAVRGLPGLTPPVVRDGCTHVYYCWALKVAGDRDWFVRAMQAEGVPMRAGYVPPLYRLPAFAQYARWCPVAERMHDKELALFEVCAWDPDAAQVQQIGSAFQKVAEAMPHA